MTKKKKKLESISKYHNRHIFIKYQSVYPKVTSKDQNMKNQWRLVQLFRNDPNGPKAKFHHVKARNLKARINLSLLVEH